MHALIPKWFVIIIALVLATATGQTQNPFDIKRKDTTQKKETTKPITPPVDLTVKPNAPQKPVDAVRRKPESRDSTPPQQAPTKSSSNNPFDLNARPANPVQPPKTTDLSEAAGDVPLADSLTPDNTRQADSIEEDTQANRSGGIFDLKSKTSEPEPVLMPEKTKDPANDKVESYFERITGSIAFWLLFICLLGVTAVVNMNRAFMVELTQSLISENFFRLSYREFSKGISQYLHLALYLVFFLQGALFVYFLLNYWSGYNLSYWWILAGVGVLYFAKHFVLWLLAMLFPVSKETAQYSFSTMQYNVFLGLVLFAINWLLAFGPANLHNGLLLSGIGAFVILYIMRQFRGLLIGVRLASLYKFQFFLYLCAIEIGPILLIYRQISLQLFS